MMVFRQFSKARRKAFFSRIHILLGLILSLPLVAVIVTGILLGFQEGLPGSNRLRSAEDGGEKPARALVLAQIERLQDTLRIESIEWIGSFSPKVRVKFQRSDGTRGRWDLDGRQEPREAGVQRQELFWKWVYQIHRGTWGGLGGRILMSGVGILTFILWLFGILIQRRKSAAQFWHVQTGAGLGWILTCMALSGAWINFKREWVQVFDPLPISIEEGSAEKSQWPQLHRQLELAQSLRGEIPLISTYLDVEDAHLNLFYFEDSSRVYLNSHCLQVVKVMTPRSHWIHAIFPLHGGIVWGRFRSVFILSMGVLFLLVVISGLRLSRKRKLT